ncbi:hypothetical protein FNF27_06721 [Cafeteria roenbergensis]|uniref:DNA-(apurinic or apyrimidinic site) endonuclease n=1 Tax=Cafeteria roenbergensis TaxID=33653 RepID=A0A5A8DY62_CAFRO|nr:hypothetical protein FNF27_06721 [Cafeteria roenbergensis]
MAAAPAASAHATRVPAKAASHRILTWNCAGWAAVEPQARRQHGSLAAFLDHTLADVVLVQEHKLTRDKVKRELAMLNARGEAASGWETYWAFSTTKTGYSGTLTAVRKGSGLEPVEAASDALGREFDDEGRCVLTRHGVSPGGMTLVNVYTPNGGDRPARARLAFKLRFLARLRALIDSERAAGRRVVLAGDLNIPRSARDAFWSADGSSELGYSDEETGWLAAICGADDPTCAPLVDTFRACHPAADGAFTVWDQRKAARTRNQGVRIDFVMLDRELQHTLRGAAIVYTPPAWSDHVAVCADVDLPPPVLNGRPESAKPPPLAAERWPELRSAGKSLASFFGRAPKRPAGSPDPPKTAGAKRPR